MLWHIRLPLIIAAPAVHGPMVIHVIDAGLLPPQGDCARLHGQVWVVFGHWGGGGLVEVIGTPARKEAGSGDGTCVVKASGD